MNSLERYEVGGLRAAMGRLGLVVAEIDLDLRYKWIDNQHPDFDAAAVIGKRDDELIPRSEADQIMSLKREVLHGLCSVNRTLAFKRSDGTHYYNIYAYPVRDSKGNIDGILTVGFDLVATPGDGQQVDRDLSE